MGNIRGACDKFPDFFCMCTFIDSTHMKLVAFEVISFSCNALVALFQQLLEGPMEVLFHLLKYLITTALLIRE